MTARTWTAEEVRALGVVTDVVTAGAVLGLSKNVSYGLAAAGNFPVRVLSLGSRRRVPVADLLRVLGLEPDLGSEDGTTRTATAVRTSRDPAGATNTAGS